MAHNRRRFLQYLGAGLTGTAHTSGRLGPIAQARGHIPFQGNGGTTHRDRPGDSILTFDPIRPTTRDDLVLPAGFTYDVIALWGDRLPGTNSRFGYNADFTAFFPTAADGREGVLWVNHEYVSLPDIVAGEIGVYTQSFPFVDPAWTPVKHTMLGRFRHENVAIRTAPGEHVILSELRWPSMGDRVAVTQTWHRADTVRR